MLAHLDMSHAVAVRVEKETMIDATGVRFPVVRVITTDRDGNRIQFTAIGDDAITLTVTEE